MNISDIAKMAGVSPSTVSRYLNNGYVSEEKKRVIRKVIDETGYAPLTSAQNLRNRKMNVIGVIVPKISSESISVLVAPWSLLRKMHNDEAVTVARGIAVSLVKIAPFWPAVNSLTVLVGASVPILATARVASAFAVFGVWANGAVKVLAMSGDPYKEREIA